MIQHSGLSVGDDYDGLSGKMFNLCAAVLWCIRDYPAFNTLPGRTTKGYFICIDCDKHPLLCHVPPLSKDG
jgi:hypothetical protein